MYKNLNPFKDIRSCFQSKEILGKDHKKMVSNQKMLYNYISKNNRKQVLTI